MSISWYLYMDSWYMMYADIDLENTHTFQLFTSKIKLTNYPYTCYEKRSVLKGLSIYTTVYSWVSWLRSTRIHHWVIPLNENARFCGLGQAWRFGVILSCFLWNCMGISYIVLYKELVRFLRQYLRMQTIQETQYLIWCLLFVQFLAMVSETKQKV